MSTRYSSMECADAEACGDVAAAGGDASGRSLGYYANTGRHQPALAESYYYAQSQGDGFQVDAQMRASTPYAENLRQPAAPCKFPRDRIPLPQMPSLLNPDLDPRPDGINVYGDTACIRAQSCKQDSDCDVAACCGIVRTGAQYDYIHDVDACNRVRDARCDLTTQTCAGKRHADS